MYPRKHKEIFCGSTFSIEIFLDSNTVLGCILKLVRTSDFKEEKCLKLVSFLNYRVLV